MWNQVYNPFSNEALSTLVAAIPVVTLLVLIASGKVKAHIAAVIALAVAIFIAVEAFTMPSAMAIRAGVLGLVTGFFPIGWIVLNVIFLYRLTVEKGVFVTLQQTIGGVTPDRRLQLLLIAFAFGAFFEGASGFGTPVAVTGAILIGLGFSPLAASGLIWVFAGWKGMKDVWPAILVTGVSFAIPQFLISNFVNPYIVDIGASLISMACLIGFLKVWQPKTVWTSPKLRTRDDSAGTAPAPMAMSATKPTRAEVWKSLTPWIIVCAILLVWGTGWFKAAVNPHFTWSYPVPGLHNMIDKVPPVVAKPTPEGAVFAFTWLSYTGTGMLIAAIISGFVMGFSPMGLLRSYGRTIWVVRYSLITISAMLGIGTLTRFSGLDATLGLAFAHTGVLYPFFGTLLGWLGVALTGSDTSSNVLFGSLQTITARKVGVSETLMAAANSAGGVMGKMIDAQSIVVASTATRWFGHESRILRYVFRHSIALAALVGIWVMLQAYVWPISALVVR